MLEGKLRVEYLVIVNTTNSFCATEKAFNNLIRTNSDITLQNGNLSYKNINLVYKVQTKKMEIQENDLEEKRFFHVHFICNDSSKIIEFEGFLKMIRELLFKSIGNLQTLWDDVSFYYSNKAYPLIYEIENTMRKLITKFMLTNVGLGWTKDNIPEEVKKSVKSSKRVDTADYLYKTDFIQLSNFLFKDYSSLSINSLMERLKETTDLNQLSLDELKEYVPKSNWKKYFSDLVECEAEYLDKRWNRLYELRNQIAHNNIISRRDYEDIIKIVAEVKQKLEKAINSLDKIHIPTKDKEIVAENIASSANNVFHDFLHEYNTLESILNSFSRNISGEQRSRSLSRNAKYLEEYGLIDKKTIKEINNLRIVRNTIVHHTDITIEPEDIIHWTTMCEVCIDKVLAVSIDYYGKQIKDDDNLENEK